MAYHMDINLKIIISVVVVAVILLIIIIIAICRICLWRKIRSPRGLKKTVPNGLRTVATGYPKMPPLRVVGKDTQIVQMAPSDQYSRYAELNRPARISLSSSDGKSSGGSDGFEGRVKRNGYAQIPHSNSDDLYHFQKCSPLPRQDAINCTEIYYPQTNSPITGSQSVTPVPSPRNHRASVSFERKRPKFVLKKSRRASSATAPMDAFKNSKQRFRSESDLSHVKYLDVDGRRSNRSSTLSLHSPADGLLDFSLFYKIESKTLDICVNRLLDLSLRPESLVGVLDVCENSDKTKSKAYLREREDKTLELVHSVKIGYIVYVSLLPDMKCKRHTGVQFSCSNAFNELLSMESYSLEELKRLSLCFHLLCQFGVEGEPLVIGEIIQPLKHLQPSLSIPYTMNLESPTVELELERDLKSTTLGELQVIISYNPIAHQLVVKIVQATGIPKIGMTGHPNVSVKVSLYYCGSRIQKQSTAIHKRQKEPVFNEAFQFDISKDRISECDILFEVRHHGPMHRTVIGYVNVGKSAGGKGANHWRQLLDFSHFENVHKIVPNKTIGLV